jgi:hypothetical protein
MPPSFRYWENPPRALERTVVPFPEINPFVMCASHDSHPLSLRVEPRMIEKTPRKIRGVIRADIHPHYAIALMT